MNPIDELIQSARAAREKAQAIYSNFKVGAALRTKSVNIFTGSNIESSSYGLTICAERVAIFKAVSEGETDITDIAIIITSRENMIYVKGIGNIIGKTIRLISKEKSIRHTIIRANIKISCKYNSRGI